MAAKGKAFTSILSFAFLAIASTALGQGQEEKLDLTVDQWREDLRFLSQEIPKRHANAFHSISKAAFDEAVKKLELRLPQLNADQAWTGLASIASLIGDAHTYLRFPSDCPSLPLDIDKFGTDYRVSRVAPGLEKALGTKVLAIADTPVAQARELMRPLVPHNVLENRSEALAAIDFTAGCVLRGVGITKERDTARFTLQADDGGQFIIDAKALSEKEIASVRWIWPFQELPLFRRERERPFWQIYLSDKRTLYSNVRSMRNLREPGQQIENAVKANSPEKLVIDLRQNPGGDYFEGLKHLVKPIAANQKLNAKGHLFVLIGPLTFSAAMANAAHFREMTAATLVGEAIGVRPNEYSEPKNIRLPNSKLTLRYSTKLYQFVKSGENVVKPDVELKTSWADYQAGRDPVLEWVLKQ